MGGFSQVQILPNCKKASQILNWKHPLEKYNPVKYCIEDATSSLPTWA